MLWRTGRPACRPGKPPRRGWGKGCCWPIHAPLRMHPGPAEVLVAVTTDLHDDLPGGTSHRRADAPHRGGASGGDAELPAAAAAGEARRYSAKRVPTSTLR